MYVVHAFIFHIVLLQQHNLYRIYSFFNLVGDIPLDVSIDMQCSHHVSVIANTAR